MRNNPLFSRKKTFSAVALGISCLLCSLVGCTDLAILNQHASISNRKWYYNEQPKFSVNVSDNSVKYDMYISLRHSSGYRFSNIFLLLKETSPTDSQKNYRVELKLAELDGRWLGKGSGNLYSHEIRVSKDYLYPDTGIYTYQLEQNMRVNPLLEVVDVGIRIVPSRK